MIIASTQNTSKERKKKTRTLSTAGAKLHELNFLFFTKFYHFIQLNKISPESLQIRKSIAKIKELGYGRSKQCKYRTVS